MKRGLLYVLSVSLTVFVYSCKEDEAQEPPCGLSLSKFTGTWNITEECDSNQYSYPLAVSENSTGGITLSNLGDGGTNSTVEAVVEGDAFIITQQLVGGIATAGNGSLNAGCIQLVIQWTGAKGICTSTGIR